MVEYSRMETLLRHDKWIVNSGLVIMAGLSWLYLFNATGMTMSMMDLNHGSYSLILNYWILMFLMWWIMMIAMMIPSAAPMVLLYTKVMRFAQKDAADKNVAALSMLFVTGYLVCWAVFSIIATLMQWSMEQNSWLTMQMAFNQRWLIASLLIAVGFYQLTPLKASCLENCRAPTEFFARHMRSGYLGALQMGLVHGAYCVGCCWLLMLLLFVGGVMNLLWIVFLTFIVMAEKLFPFGENFSGFSGYLFITWGIVIIYTSF